MPLWDPSPRIQVDAQGVLPAGCEHSSDRPRFSGSPLQSKRDRTAMWRLP